MPRSSQDDPSAAHGGPLNVRTRTGRLLAGTVAVTVIASGLTLAGSQSAAAAPSQPNAQAVARLLDGSLGGQALGNLADVQEGRTIVPADAQRKNLPDNSLSPTLLGQLNLPLSGVLQLPGAPALGVGVAQQITKGSTNGSSQALAGTAANSGGVSLGGDPSSAGQAFATVNLSGSSLMSALGSANSVNLPGLPKLPGVPSSGGGASSLDALGSIRLDVGALYASGAIDTGAKNPRAQSGVAGLNLVIASPLLGGAISQLSSLLNPAALSNLPGLSGILDALKLPGASSIPGVSNAQSKCALTQGTLPSLKLDYDSFTKQYAVEIDPSSGSITVRLRPLVHLLLGLDIQEPDRSNIDLVKFLVQHLPTILSSGLTTVIRGITDSLTTQFSDCTTALDAIPVAGTLLDGVLSPLITQLAAGEAQLSGAFIRLGTVLGTPAAGGLATLAGGLTKVLDLGLNVQSGDGAMKSADSTILFTTKLKKTPNQYDTGLYAPNKLGPDPVIPGQTLARALEINVLSGAPGLSGGVATLALANVAVGPNHPAAAPPASTTPASPHPSTQIPTGVNAGAADHGGTPAAPIVLLIIAVLMAGAGAMAWRVRGRHLT